MKRLLDEVDLSEDDGRLADLFRSAAPFTVNPFRKRRVLVSLERVQNRPASRWWLKPAVVSAVLVSGTAAAAVLSHEAAVRHLNFFGGSSTPSATVSPPPARRAHAGAARPKAAASAQASSLWVDDAPAAEPAVVAAPERAASRGRLRARPDTNEDATRVVEAIQALRTGRDPVRAQSLLNEYLKSHPRGALSEEASALSMEAASAQHDPRAIAYARRYLASFPNGKYRALAQRALESAP